MAGKGPTGPPAKPPGGRQPARPFRPQPRPPKQPVPPALKRASLDERRVENLLKQQEWVVITTPGCGYCTKAIDYLDERAQRFVAVGVDNEQKKIHAAFLREIAVLDPHTGVRPRLEAGGPLTFPMIFHKGRYIGGYAELTQVKGLQEMEVTSNIHMRVPDPTSKSPFIGLPWPQLTVLLYLNHKHRDNCTPIPRELFEERGVIKSSVVKRAARLEWNDVSMKWAQRDPKRPGALEIPPNYWKAVKDCVKKKTRFITIPFGFSCTDSQGRKSGHANMLVYDSKTKELERFEPNASMGGGCFDPPGLDEMLKKLFNQHVKVGMVKKAIPPLGYCPEGFQAIQALENEDLPTDPSGWCAVWSAWYADTRLLNPNKSREEVVKLAMNKLERDPESFTKFIRNYSMFIVKAADALKTTRDPEIVFAKLLRGEKFV